MKSFSFLVAMVVTASVAIAQQPPRPPALPVQPPLPAPVPPAPTAPLPPTPASAPRAPVWPNALQGAARASSLYDYGIDADMVRSINAEARAAAVEARSDAVNRYSSDSRRTMDDAQMAVQEQRLAIDGQHLAEQVRDRVNDLRLNINVAPMSNLSASINSEAQAYASSVYGATFGNGMNSLTYSSALAPLGRWQQDWKQDRDPADSMLTSARDALNRGEWRRAADIFSQVYTKYPKSARLQQAAYYEAFARYRIGTTDELKASLKVLNDRAQGGSNTSNSNEIQILTTRVRGVLAQRGDVDAARQLQADAQKGKSCDNEDMQVRSEALSALAQSDMATATPLLRRVLEKKDPCTLELRRRALSILLRRADTAATSAAISVAKNADETIDLRTDAISYLARLPGENAVSALQELLRTSTDRDIQRAAIRSLANTDNTKARQSIRLLVERSDVGEQLRIEALNTFDRDRGTGADDAAFLRALYPKLQSDALKRAAIAAISKNAGTENEQFVMAVARNTAESSEVRSNAISRMYRIPAISIADISKLYDSADSRSMRTQIINVLAQRNEPETVDKLGEIAKTSTDPSMRSQAISALSRKTDPRARKVIVDLAAGTP
jgi:HEAT repeat protein